LLPTDLGIVHATVEVHAADSARYPYTKSDTGVC
jgi:hypothetical protein